MPTLKSMKRASILSSASLATLPPPPSPPPPFLPRSPTTRLFPDTDDIPNDMATTTTYISESTTHLDEYHETRSYTSDLADFLRSTGPDGPPTPPPSLPPLALEPRTSSNFLKRYLKRKDSSSQTSLTRQPSISSQKAASARRLTSTTFTTAAVNKALHNVPPANVETRVFANGQTIYMINTPSASSALSNTSAGSQTLRAPPKSVIRPIPSFHSDHGASSSSKPIRRPATATPVATSPSLQLPAPHPRHASMNVSRALSPITSDADYDIRFNSSASEMETTPKGVGARTDADTSDNDTGVSTLMANRHSVSTAATTAKRTSASSTRKSSSELSLRGKSGGTARRRSSNGSLASARSNSQQQSQANRSPRSILTAPVDPDAQWVSRDIIGSPRVAVAVTAPSPPLPTSARFITRERSGSDLASPSSPAMNGTKRDRSTSLTVGKRSSGPTMTGLGLGAPMSPPPTGPPPPAPIPATPNKKLDVPGSNRRDSSPRPTSKRASKSTRNPVAEPDKDLFFTPNTSPATQQQPHRQPASFSVPSSATTRTISRRGSAPDPAYPMVKSESTPQIHFKGYMFPVPPEKEANPAPRQSSAALEKQLESVMKMNEAYAELGKAAKNATAVAEFEREPSLRTLSTASTMSNAAITIASVVGPPRLPLPPSPITTASLGSPVSLNGGLSPITQAQITSLTFALHAQRTQYEMLQARVTELMEEREQFAKRVEECERDVEVKEKRIAVLEEEKFAWERERSGLRWLVNTSTSPTAPLKFKTSESQTTVVEGTEEVQLKSLRPPAFKRSVTMPSHINVVAASAGGAGLTANIEIVSPSKRDAAYFGSATSPREFTSFPANDTPKRPLSMVSSGRTSTELEYKKLKRHSMFEPSAAAGSSASRRPLSVALDDMLSTLRSLGEEDDAASSNNHGSSSVPVSPTNATFSSRNRRSMPMSMSMSLSTSSPLLQSYVAAAATEENGTK